MTGRVYRLQRQQRHVGVPSVAGVGLQGIAGVCDGHSGVPRPRAERLTMECVAPLEQTPNVPNSTISHQFGMGARAALHLSRPGGGFGVEVEEV